MRVPLAISLVLAAAIACSRPPRHAADLVITRAAIWTGDSAKPAATAVAVIGDRIVDVGGGDDIERWRGANTTVIDAGGRRLVPGFNDAHVHVVDGGAQLDSVDLRDAATREEFARRIAERARAKPGEWILGGNWDDRQWTPAGPPTRALIDDASNSSPVFVVRYDGQMALANSAALGRAGVTERTADPPGGTLLRDANGPTGVLTGSAIDIVARVIPAMTEEQRRHAVKRALELAASFGVTSVQDMSATAEDIAVYADLANRRELTARVYAVPVEAGWYDQAKLGVRRAFGSPWLRIGAVQGEAGAGVDHVNERRTRLMAADHAGLQLCVDAIGDAGTPRALDVLEAIIGANGGRDRRSRIEHASRFAPADVDRMAALNVMASVQPSAVPSIDGLRALTGKGVRLALGSGWPAAPLNPMVTLQAAALAQLTAAEALSAQTRGSTFAEFQESEKGTIARGALADMVILSDDILSIPAARLTDVRVLTTMVGGKIVHQRNP